MSRFVGLISLAPEQSGADVELVAEMAARRRHVGAGPAMINSFGPLAAAISATPQDDQEATARYLARDPARQVVLLMDGALFNGTELECELRKSGSLVAASPSVAELALAAYVEWGESCFSRLSGIFAIVVLDQAGRKCLLARDAFGAKSLNYVQGGQRLAFASEVGPLLPLAGGARVNKRALIEFTMHGDVLPPETLFEGVLNVPPGHYLRIDLSRPDLRMEQFHDAFNAVSEATHDRLRSGGADRFLDELDGQLHRSIRENLASGGPFGIALSGGVDSAVLTAIAARYAPVHAINVSVPQGRNLDERAMAEAVTRHVGVPISVITMSGELYRRELAAATFANEMPLWHVQNLGYFLASRRANELGLRSLLCGDTIGMMLSPASHFPWRNLQPLMALTRLAPAALSGFIQKLGYGLSGLPLNSAGFSWAMPMATQLIDGHARARMQQQSEARYSFERSQARRRILGGRLADVYMLFNRFYYRGDRLGQAWGVEYRTPFGDDAALQLAINLPYEYLNRRGVSKWSIKAVGTRYIPREIAFQKKVAWNMPRDIYFAPLGVPEFFDDGFCASTFGLTRKAIRDCIGSWRYEPQILARLVHMEVWGRLFAMGETVEQVNARIADIEAATQ